MDEPYEDQCQPLLKQAGGCSSQHCLLRTVHRSESMNSQLSSFVFISDILFKSLIFIFSS